MIFYFKNEKVLTTTRRFQSSPDQSVPIFLPDHDSEWHTTFSNIDESSVIGNQKEYKERVKLAFEENEKLISLEEETKKLTVKESNLDDDDGSSVISSDENDDNISTSESDEDDVTSKPQYNWSDLLGMRAFKVVNKDERIANMIVKPPSDPSCLMVADFEESAIRAHLLHNYARNIMKQDSGRSLEEKKDVEDWLKTIPPRPFDKSKGFNSGEAKKWFDHVYGIDHKLVLQRVLEKSCDSKLKRPDQTEYLKTHALTTDQETLASLPEEEFLTSVGNSHNRGSYFIL